MTNPENVGVQSPDGRVGGVTCIDCDAEPKIGVDPLDNTLVLVCPECESVVLIADVIESRVDVNIAVDSVDDLDPRLRDRVQQQLRERDSE